MKTPAITICFASLFSAAAPAALTNYWPLDGAPGATTAPSTVAGGTAATLFAGSDFVVDLVRGAVLETDGLGGYAEAGTLPELNPDNSFTWSFWANSSGANAATATILGNRTPDTGWTKFTPGAFDYRDIDATFNGSIDYADFTPDVWAHHAVVKNGSLFTYYRNGVAYGNNWTVGVMPAGTPLYFGGDATNESWTGRLDEIATWTNALPTASIAGLAAGTYKPTAAPLTYAPGLTDLLVDDFSGGLTKWTVTNRGLENNLAAGYAAPAVAGGAVTLGGTTTNSYWYGSSLESTQTFDASLYTQVSVKRVSLTGTGTAYRSSLWILGDATHYLHLSQNVGEGGWSWNSSDAGGVDFANATGSGSNLAGMDEFDGDLGEQEMTIRVVPAGRPGAVNMEIVMNGSVQAVRGFQNFPTTFRVVLTGQARQAADTVSAVFDDLRVARETLLNLPPIFGSSRVFLPAATPGAAYSGSLAGKATDPDNDTLVYSKTSGPAWLTVSANGTVSGTPPADGATFAEAGISVSDGRGGSANATLALRLATAAAPRPGYFGWWPLNQTGGTLATEATGAAGGANSATISNAATGGLGTNGSTWRTDPQFGQVLSFNGTDVTGATAVVGNPPDSGLLPVLDAATDFSWSFWAKPNQTGNNDIILGNRYDSTGGDLLQFVKFTSSQLEWYFGGTPQGIDYADPEPGVWAHHVLVKDGETLYYYRNGALAGVRTVTVFPDQELPLFFGGQRGAEAWTGDLHDVRLFTGALSETDIAAVAAERGQFPQVAPAFTNALIVLPDAAPGVPYSQNIATFASDPQGGALTFTLTGGSPWLTLSPQGVLSGTPDTTPPLAAEAQVTVRDNQNLSAGAVFQFRIGNPAAPVPPMFGWWPLDDGTGETAADTSGNGNTAIITNATTGGLGPDGSVWFNDPVEGVVFSSNGTDAIGAWASVGDPFNPVLLPALGVDGSFTWSFRAKPDQVPNTDVILGNRFDPNGGEYSPRQFVKFTGLSFEWHRMDVGEDLNYPDLPTGVWAHHTVVKDGPTLFYYRDGVLSSSRAITEAPDQAMPVYFSGVGPGGLEVWRGYLADIRLFNGALSSASVDLLAKGQLVTAPVIPGFVITSVVMGPDRSITLQWAVEAGASYTVQGSTNMAAWQVLTSNATGTYTVPAGATPLNPATEPRLYFRVVKNP